MKIKLYTEGIRGNCDFCLRLHDGAVFADFKIKGTDTIRLVRISFDGFGCCETKMIRAMAASDSKLLLAAVKTGHVETQAIAMLLKRYFSQNDGVICKRCTVPTCIGRLTSPKIGGYEARSF
jgi:hypothetical protein